MKRKLLILIILIIFLSCTFSLADNQKTIEMDLAQCVQKALEVNPDLKSAVAKMQMYEAKLGQAKSDYLPQINVSGGYNRGDKNSTTPAGGPSHSSSDSAVLTQLLYDFDRTPLNIAMSNEKLKQYYYDTIDKSQDVLFDVITYYYNLLAKQELFKVKQQNVENLKTHLKQATGFYSAGTKSKIDVTTAQVNLSKGELQLIEAENDVRVAKSQLAKAIGLDNFRNIELKSAKKIPEFKLDLDESYKLALKLRPDYLKSEAKLKEADLKIKWALTTNMPSLSSNAGYYWSGTDYPLDRTWNIGLSLSWSLFDGGYTQWLAKESQANLRDLDSQQKSLKQTIYLEVSESYANYIKAKESLEVFDKTVFQAKENLELASERYKAGVGDIVELTQAELDYLSARTNRINNTLDYLVYKAALEASMGQSLAKIYCGNK